MGIDIDMVICLLESVMLKLYFVRHGESIANLLHEFSNTGCKHPLTENGINQAKLLADQLSGLQITQIYSSPILRAWNLD
ncbi:histidine phosphatase family protein [Pseudanabaena yagii]|uniref:Histidine phosphatase family protein n=1 Tax=Pseudanabaena yagii GIHE-NHR1 TaxID=2722753 RepID=A0ABX1LL99_9CYAN|nr:histidine phosphatase family protein [Pseudanabaena yagii]NMF56882.1 histidine phosphatase family protein [Pseudanabaena yagii GIHE-NHR1]